MPRIIKPLTAAQVRAINQNGWHAVGGVNGLYLQVKSQHSRSWILRTLINGKRKVIGLGSCTTMSLSAAREEAFKRLMHIQSGNIAAAIPSKKSSKTPTFEYCALELIASKRSGWKNPKSESQWANTLKTYAYPVIGNLDVSDITSQHLLQILKPHWETKTDTMTKVRARIQNVLNWAKTCGYRSGPNPADWSGNLEYLLPAASKISSSAHHRSLHYSDVAPWFQRIQESDGMGARCLAFIILTAVRSTEARLATWEEFDLDQAVWRISAERMKMKRDFEVPLSTEAMTLLQKLPRTNISDLVFHGKGGKCLSDATVLRVLQRLNAPCVVHGFRSTFSTWAAEKTDAPREVREMSLSHKIGSDVELAYMRGHLLDKRRNLMESWSTYLTS